MGVSQVLVVPNSRFKASLTQGSTQPYIEGSVAYGHFAMFNFYYGSATFIAGTWCIYWAEYGRPTV